MYLCLLYNRVLFGINVLLETHIKDSIGHNNALQFAVLKIKFEGKEKVLSVFNFVRGFNSSGNFEICMGFWDSTILKVVWYYES